MMDINYELYKVFYHVATTLNFSEASKPFVFRNVFFGESVISCGRMELPAGEFPLGLPPPVLTRFHVRYFAELAA